MKSIRGPTAERRDGARLVLRPDEALVEFVGSCVVQVRDVSASGSGLFVPESDATLFTDRPALFRAGEDVLFGARFNAVRVAREDGGFRIGTRFAELSDEAERRLARFIIASRQRHDRRLSRILGGAQLRNTRPADRLRQILLRRGRPLSVYHNEDPLPLLLRARAITNAMMEISVQGDHGLLIEKTRYHFLASARTDVILFETIVLQRKEQIAWIAMPGELIETGFRSSIRSPVAPFEPVAVSFFNPRKNGKCIQASVIDVSGCGFAFRPDDAEALLFPGDQVHVMTIFLPDGTMIAASGLVCRVTPSIEGDAVLCGVEISDFADEMSAEAWKRFAFKAAHPRTSLDENAVEAAWNVLERSNYVRLWTSPEQRPHIRRRFVDAWSSATKRVGRLLTLHADAGAIGTVAVSRVYPRTWLLHSLSVDREYWRKHDFFFGVTRELYAAILYVFEHMTGSEFFLGYVDKDKRWTELLYGDFVRSYVDKESFVLDEFGVYKSLGVGVDDARRDEVSSVSIAHNDATLVRELSRSLRMSVSSVEYETFSFATDEIDLREFSSYCASLGYEHKRDFYFALEDGLPTAALIAEIGEEGHNVFGLMNRCWIARFEPAKPTESTKRALLRTAHDHYKRHGKREFLFFDAPGAADRTLEEVALRFISDGFRWMGRRSVIKAWLAYVEETLEMKRDSLALKERRPKE